MYIFILQTLETCEQNHRTTDLAILLFIRFLVSCPSFPRKSREEIIRSHLKRNSSLQHDEEEEEERDVVDGPQSTQVNTDSAFSLLIFPL